MFCFRFFYVLHARYSLIILVSYWRSRTWWVASKCTPTPALKATVYVRCACVPSVNNTLAVFVITLTVLTQFHNSFSAAFRAFWHQPWKKQMQLYRQLLRIEMWSNTRRLFRDIYSKYMILYTFELNSFARNLAWSICWCNTVKKWSRQNPDVAYETE